MFQRRARENQLWSSVISIKSHCRPTSDDWVCEVRARGDTELPLHSFWSLSPGSPAPLGGAFVTVQAHPDWIVACPSIHAKAAALVWNGPASEGSARPTDMPTKNKFAPFAQYSYSWNAMNISFLIASSPSARVTGVSPCPNLLPPHASP